MITVRDQARVKSVSPPCAPRQVPAAPSTNSYCGHPCFHPLPVLCASQMMRCSLSGQDRTQLAQANTKPRIATSRENDINAQAAKCATAIFPKQRDVRNCPWSTSGLGFVRINMFQKRNMLPVREAPSSSLPISRAGVSLRGRLLLLLHNLPSRIGNRRARSWQLVITGTWRIWWGFGIVGMCVLE